MAKVLTKGKVTMARPVKGARIIRVEAEVLVVEKLARITTPQKIRKALRGLEPKIKREVASSIRRSYAASGLRKKSKKLFKTATENFKIKIKLEGRRKIIITARWNAPNIDYFFIHLFKGVTIVKPVTAQALRFKIRNKVIFAKSVEIPGRPYLKLDKKSKDKIVLLLERAINQELKKNAPDELEEAKQAVGKSIFRVRRQLRKKGKSAAEARRRAKELVRP